MSTLSKRNEEIIHYRMSASGIVTARSWPLIYTSRATASTAFAALEVCRVRLHLPDDGLRPQPQRTVPDQRERSRLDALPDVQVVAPAAWPGSGMRALARSHAVFRPSSPPLHQAAPRCGKILCSRRAHWRSGRRFYSASL